MAPSRRSATIPTTLIGNLPLSLASGPFSDSRAPIWTVEREKDMRPQRPTIAPEITACITNDRDPTVQELCTVADQIHRDLQLAPSAFSPVIGPMSVLVG